MMIDILKAMYTMLYSPFKQLLKHDNQCFKGLIYSFIEIYSPLKYTMQSRQCVYKEAINIYVTLKSMGTHSPMNMKCNTDILTGSKFYI